MKILYFVTGFGIGGGISYLLTRKFLDHKYDTALEREIADMRDYYERTRVTIDLVKDIPTTEKTGVSAQNGPKSEKKDSEEPEITEDSYFSKKNRGKHTNYSSYSDADGPEFGTNLYEMDPGGPTDDDPYEEEGEEECENPEFEDETDHIESIRMSKLGIELISAIDYNERNGYEKEELFYYKKTKTLADTNDEIVEDSEDVVGTAYEDIIFQGNAGTIYVRNNGFAKDYLITVLNERYDFSRL